MPPTSERTPWTKRLVIGTPFAIAALLNVLSIVSGRLRLNGERIAGYGFMFATPWAWLLDRGWIPSIHNRAAEELVAYALVLWIPAALYSGCIWLLFIGFGLSDRSFSRAKS